MAQYDERYATLEQVKRELPWSAADFDDLDQAGFDALLQGDATTDGLLERESSRLEEWADTQWVTSQFTETTERPEFAPSQELPLSKRPVQSVASVTVDGDALAADQYVVEETHLHLVDDADPSSWPTDYRSVEVTYTHGYEAVPSEVTGALIRLVRNALDQVQSDGLESESVGDMSFSYRTPREIRQEVQGEIPSAPSYHGGANVV